MLALPARDSVRLGPIVLLASFLVGLGLRGASAAEATLTVEHLRCEYLHDPLGIDVRQPRLSWQLASPRRAQRQTAYRVLVASSPEKLAADLGDRWDSGRVASDQSTQVVYAGQPLGSEQRCYWKVQVWDAQGEPSPWSPVASWSMGLLQPGDWRCAWIAAPNGPEPESPAVKPEERRLPLPLLRKSFSIDQEIQSATLYASSLGLHEVFLNGRRVGDHVFDPIESDYRRRVYYVTHDVTDMLAAGENVLGVALGYGWYRQPCLGVTMDRPALRLQLAITYRDGSRRMVLSDGTWKTSFGPRALQGNWKYRDFGGECYDARREQPGWNQKGFDDVAWLSAATVEVPPLTLSAQMVPPNRVGSPLRPIAVSEFGPGEYLVDVGRNLTGWFRLALTEPAGREITLQYSASHDPGDNPWQETFGQSDHYLCREGRQEFCSQFQWRSFRYVKLSGLSRKPSLDEMMALPIGTDLTPAAAFRSSDDRLNRLYDIVLHTHRCLTLNAIQVDCEHRERLGYGAEAQVGAESAMVNFEAAPLFTKWARDFADGQDATGVFPTIAPAHIPIGGGPAWSGAGLALPWLVHLYYGDRRILAEHYDAIGRWLGFLEQHSQGDLLQPYGPKGGHECMEFLADWASPPLDSELSTPCGRLDSGRGHRPQHWLTEREKLVFNNCYYYLQVSQAAQIARLLGKTSDAERHAAKAEAIQQAFNRVCFDPQHNRYTPGPQQQSYLAFALLLDLVPPGHRDQVLKNLVDDIVTVHQGHLDFGVLGSYYTLASLVRERRSDLIYPMTVQRTAPSWGHMVDRGATTLWEYWYPERSSVHSSYLAIGSWFFQGLAGIQPDPEQPGFQRVLLRPQVVPGLDWVQAHCDTPRGRVGSSWKVEKGQFDWEVAIPANTTALVFVPARDLATIREGNRPVEEAEGIKLLRQDPDAVVLQVESGDYRFQAMLP